MSTSRQAAYSEPGTDSTRTRSARGPTVRANVRRFARPEPLRRARFDRRGHHLRKRLLEADLLALCAAYLLATIWAPPASVQMCHFPPRPGLLVASLPVWILLAYVHALYHVGSRRSDHG